MHAWYYHWHHFHRHDVDYEMYYEEWYFAQRSKANKIVRKYFRYKPEIYGHVDRVWNEFIGESDADKFEILGVHMRGTDKAAGRRKIGASEYLKYIHRFIEYFGRDHVKVFVATDDANYLMEVKQSLDHLDDARYDKIWFAQNDVVRSNTSKAVFELQGVSRYEIGKNVITDILLLSKCDWFIHSASAVAEAVHYNNILLHNKSVHLEYKKKRQSPIWYWE